MAKDEKCDTCKYFKIVRIVQGECNNGRSGITDVRVDSPSCACWNDRDKEGQK